MLEEKIDQIRDIICDFPLQSWEDDFTTIYRGKKIEFASRDNAKQMLLVVDGIKIEDKDDKILKYYRLLRFFIDQKKEKEKIYRIEYVYELFMKKKSNSSL